MTTEDLQKQIGILLEALMQERAENKELKAAKLRLTKALCRVVDLGKEDAYGTVYLEDVEAIVDEALGEDK